MLDRLRTWLDTSRVAMASIRVGPLRADFVEEVGE